MKCQDSLGVVELHEVADTGDLGMLAAPAEGQVRHAAARLQRIVLAQDMKKGVRDSTHPKQPK
jgi:hypothetical protein